MIKGKLKPKKTKIFDFSNKELFVPVYRPLLHDQNRLKIIYGGRGSAKSFFAAQKKIIRCLSMQKFKCLMVRKMRSDVRESVYTTIKGVIEHLGLQEFFLFKEGAPKIICKLNGNSFIPLGLNEVGGKSGTAKSIFNPTDAIVEEADEITEDEFDKLSLSLRGSKHLEEILLFNPPSPDHWIVKRYFPESRATFEDPDGNHTYIEATVPGVTILHTNYKMNPHCKKPEVERHEQLKIINFSKYETDSLGLLKRKKNDGLALEAFSRDQHTTKENLFDPSRRAVVCWDFNRLPFHTVGLWQFHLKQNVFYMDLCKEFCLPGKSVRQVQQIVNSFLKSEGYESKKVRYIGDYSGKARRDHDTPSMTAKIFEEMRKAGFQVIDETKPNPSVVASLDFLNDIFAGQIFLSKESGLQNVKIQIRIHESAVFHIEDFEETKTTPEGKILKVRVNDYFMDNGVKVRRQYEKRGHAVDETRYSAVGVLEAEFEEYCNTDK